MMSQGFLIGAVLGFGLLLIATVVWGRRRERFERRVLVGLADLPGVEVGDQGSQGAARAVYGPWVSSLAKRVDAVLGGSASVRRRVARANLPISLQEFRLQQTLWGLLAFLAAVTASSMIVLSKPDRFIPLAVLCAVSFMAGALARDRWLTSQAEAREQQVVAELPVVAELLSLSVAAGEGTVAAIERVVLRCGGAFSHDLSGVLGQVRTGTSLASALDDLGRRSEQPVVGRFCTTIAIATERGTPLAEVLQAQSADVREAKRRGLIELGARREVLMMVPVVFLILPVTVLFAFYPGLIGLRLTA